MASSSEDAAPPFTVTVNKSPNSTGGSTTTTAQDTTNKLHNYVNHTYKFSIYMIPPDSFNQIYAGAVQPGNESQTILANSLFVLSDGGYGGNTANRQYFPNDLSIDNVELETVVAHNYRTRGSDVISMKFDIIEPYTSNFLTQLKAASDSINPVGQWDMSCFVMKIEFIGYDDLGKPTSSQQPIPKTTKYIPFTFINMSLKISSSGTVYHCDAIPTSSLASTYLDNVIPFHLDVQAKSVTELFQAKTAAYNNYATLNPTNARASELNTVGQYSTNQITADTTVTKGLADALNNYEQLKIQPENKVQTLANAYDFVFDVDIANSTIGDPNDFKTTATNMPNSKDTNTIDQGKTGVLTLDPSGTRFSVRAGTKITELINSVIGVSSYMTGQYSAGTQPNKPINLWKISPVIKLGKIDPGTNFWQRTVKYIVTKHTISGQDATGFGQQPVNPSEIVKFYQYIYSGLNKDILDVNIDFKMAFFEIKNGVRTNYTISANDSPGSQAQSQANTYNGSQDKRFFKHKIYAASGLADQQHTAPTTQNDATIAVQDLMSKLMDNGGDMVTLDLTIVGDPDWISQDVSLYAPVEGADITSPFHSSGSINFFNPRYFNFYFATPQTDYDDKTGLFNNSQNYSQFSGIYQVVSVKSNFSGGKFTQKLTNVRVRNQTSPTNAGAARTDTVTPTATA